MNPGGDYGKKELSPALRNRFTEIWVGGGEKGASSSEKSGATSKQDIYLEDMKQIVTKHLELDDQGKDQISSMIVQFMKWYLIQTRHPTGGTSSSSSSQLFSANEVPQLTLRDILAWVNFINATVTKKKLDQFSAYLHGANLVRKM
jgi:midasin